MTARSHKTPARDLAVLPKSLTVFSLNAFRYASLRRLVQPSAQCASGSDEDPADCGGGVAAVISEAT